MLGLFKNMVDNGECSNVELAPIAKAADAFLDIKVDYDAAGRITGMTKGNLRTKISRIFIRKFKHTTLFLLRDILKIKNKEI